MSIPFKIVYLLKDGESGENLIQTDAIMELNAIDGAKIVDNTIPSAKLNAIDGHKIVDKSIPLNKLIADFDLVYQITNSPPSVLKLGMPVYWNGTDYMPANANSHDKIPTAIIKELNEYDYTVQFSGIFILPNEKWALVTDQLDGLSVSNNRYYLSDTNDGYITNSSPALSVPIYNCLKNDGINSIVEIKFGILHSLPTNNSHSEEREIFIGNGTKNTFTLAKTPYSRNSTKVTVDGKVIQNLGFSVVNKDIVFVDAPLDEEEIEITYLSQKSFNYANIIKHTETVTILKNTFYLPISPLIEKEIMVWVGGVYQDTSFAVNGNQVTFDSLIEPGNKVQFMIFSSAQFTDFSFINRKTIGIDHTSTKTLINAFGNQASGIYDFHVMSNPLISGTIKLQETNPINVRLETLSASVSPNAFTNGKLNIYINDDGNLEFKNLTGSSFILIIERHQ